LQLDAIQEDPFQQNAFLLRSLLRVQKFLRDAFALSRRVEAKSSLKGKQTS